MGKGEFVPASYRIDKERRLVISSGTGVLTKEDIQGHMDRLLSDLEFDPTFSQLLDFREITAVEFGPEEVRQFAQRKIYSSISRRAFLVTNDLQFGLARMFETYRELNGETGIRVFRSLEEAMEWIVAGKAAS